MPAPGYVPPKPPKHSKPKQPSRSSVAQSVNQHKGTATFAGATKTAKAYGPGPVKVYTSKRAVSGTAATVKSAERQWNHASNSKIFKPTTNRKKADVVVSSYNGGKKSSVGGFTETTRKKGKPTKVRLDQRWAGNSPNLAAHELGHAAGLGHTNPRKKNEYSNSRRIMGSGVSVTPLEARAAARLQRARKLALSETERRHTRILKKKKRT